MKKFKSKRFTLVVGCLIATALLSTYAIHEGMETVAAIGLAGICAVIYWYTKQETKRPSAKK